MDISQDKRSRQVIKKLNAHRRKQAQQIDILCNDMVAAHTQFVRQVRKLTFAVNFYELTAGKITLSSLLETAAEVISEYVAQADISFILVEPDGGFSLHMNNDDEPIEIDS